MAGQAQETGAGERWRSLVDVCVVLRRPDGRVLLVERANTGIADGWLAVPAGHLEDSESIPQGVAREAAEEVGVLIAPKDLRFVHVAQLRYAAGEGRIGFFFEATRWIGEPVNREPSLCAGLHWAAAEVLPERTIPYIADVLAMIAEGRSFSVHAY